MQTVWFLYQPGTLQPEPSLTVNPFLTVGSGAGWCNGGRAEVRLWWSLYFFSTESWLKEFRQHHLGCLQIHVKNRITFYSQLRVLALNSASQLVMRPRLSMLLNGCHPRAPQRSSCRGRPWCHRLLSGWNVLGIFLCGRIVYIYIIYICTCIRICICICTYMCKCAAWKSTIQTYEYQCKYVWFTWFGDKYVFGTNFLGQFFFSRQAEILDLFFYCDYPWALMPLLSIVSRPTSKSTKVGGRRKRVPKILQRRSYHRSQDTSRLIAKCVR